MSDDTVIRRKTAYVQVSHKGKCDREKEKERVRENKKKKLQAGMYFDITTPTALLPETEYVVLCPTSVVAEALPPSAVVTSVKLVSLSWPASITPSEIILETDKKSGAAIGDDVLLLPFTIVFQGNTTEVVDGIRLDLVFSLASGVTVQVPAAGSPSVVHSLRVAEFGRSAAVGAPFKLVSYIGNDMHLEPDVWDTCVTKVCNDSPGRGLHIIALAPGTDPVDAAHSFDALFAPNRKDGEGLAQMATTTGLWGWMIPSIDEDSPSILLVWSFVECPSGTALHQSPMFKNLSTLQLALCDTFAFATDTPMRTPLFDRLATLLPSLKWLDSTNQSMPKALHVVTMNTSHLQLVDGNTGLETDADGVLQSDLEYQLSDFDNEYNEVAEEIMKTFLTRRMSALPIQALPARYLSLSTEFRTEALNVRCRMVEEAAPKALDFGSTILSTEAVHHVLVNILSSINAKLPLTTAKLHQAALGMQLEMGKTVIAEECKRAAADILSLVDAPRDMPTIENIPVFEVDELETLMSTIQRRAQSNIAKRTMLTESDVGQDVEILTNQATQLAREQNRKNSKVLCALVYQEADEMISAAVPKAIRKDQIGTIIENFQVTALRCRDEIFAKKAKGPAKEQLFLDMKCRAEEIMQGVTKGLTIINQSQVALFQAQMDFEATTLQNAAHLENLRVALTEANNRAAQEMQRQQRERVRQSQQHQAMIDQMQEDCRNALLKCKAANDVERSKEQLRLDGILQGMEVNKQSIQQAHRLELSRGREGVNTLKHTLGQTRTLYQQVQANHKAWEAAKQQANNSGGGGGGCFAVSSTVVDRRRGVVSVNQISTGDEVLSCKHSVNRHSGALEVQWEWTEVYFTDVSHDEVDIVRLTTGITGHSIELTLDHLVFARQNTSLSKIPSLKQCGELTSDGSTSLFCCIPNEMQDSGDVMMSVAEASHGASWLPVVSCDVIAERQKVKTILTLSGAVVVNGIACSCYDGHATVGWLESLDLRLLYILGLQSIAQSRAALWVCHKWDVTVGKTLRRLLGCTSRPELLRQVELGGNVGQSFRTSTQQPLS